MGLRDMRKILATAALTAILSLVGTAGIPGAVAGTFRGVREAELHGRLQAMHQEGL